jgi:preprotein translocase subunit YajC
MIIFVYFAVIALAFFFLIVLPQRRRSAAHRALLAALQVGDEVVTIGGILGTIVAIDDERIEVEVAEGVVITVARNAIAQVTSDEPPAHPGADAAGDERDDEGGA